MQHVYCNTCMSSYCLYLCLASTLESQKRHIAITDMQAMVLHGVAAHWNRIFYRIFLRVIICKFSLHISTNYTENVKELLAYAQTVDTRHSCPIFFDHLAWERGFVLTIVQLVIQSEILPGGLEVVGH